MKMPRDFADRARCWLMPERHPPDGEFVSRLAGQTARQFAVMISCDPDPVAAPLQAADAAPVRVAHAIAVRVEQTHADQFASDFHETLRQLLTEFLERRESRLSFSLFGSGSLGGRRRIADDLKFQNQRARGISLSFLLRDELLHFLTQRRVLHEPRLR